ncbi:MAG: M13 family metallopeptidase [Anaerolineaceae bacterium]|nr:M13 family metallopeptidase [Anaerolineaceae bacterium]
MLKTYRFMKMIMIAMWIAAAAMLFRTAAGFSEPGYSYTPEEIMYLTGIKNAAYKEGLRYALFDIEKDGISELFIINENHTPGTLDIYGYDPLTNKARVIFTLEGTSEVYGDTLENRILAADGNQFTEYTLTGNTLEEKTVYAAGDGNGGFPAGTDDNWKPLLWVGSDQWADGSIIGAASSVPDPGPQNDFYLSSNYEWLSQEHIKSAGEISNGFDDQEMIVSANKRRMFEDRENYQGTDIQRVRDFYDMAVNWEKRNADGVEPVRKYLDAVKRVSSLAGLTELLTDPEKTPFSFLLTISVTLDERDTSRWAVEIGEDNFSVLPRVYHTRSSEEIADARSDFRIRAGHVLLRAGFSDQETEKILSECLELEDILLPAAWPGEDDTESPLNGFLPFDTAAAFCENFPLKQILNARQVTGGKIRVRYPGYLKQLDDLYTEANLSLLRSYLLAHTAAEAAGFLDLEAASCQETGADPEDEYKEFLNENYRAEVLSRQGLMSTAAENAYMTYFADPRTRADLVTLAEEIRTAFRGILEREEWLSEAGKAAALEKLDNMTFSVMAPDVLIDSSYLAVDPEKSFLDNYAAVIVNRMKHNNSFAGKVREKGDWRYDLRPEIASSVSNAFYYGCFNQFFILAGMVSDPYYRPDMPQEEKLALLGAVIGHELTHGFDPNGIRYDKDGNLVLTEDSPCGWMPEADYSAFIARAQRIADYFDRILPFPYEHCPGETQWGEAAADIGGLTIALEIAKKTAGFDYDLFFRTYSGLWRRQSTLDWERVDIHDAHPLSHLRINVTVQQFDEFLRTYDVRENDLMYPAPGGRIRIW